MSKEEMTEILNIILEYDLIDLEYVFEIPEERIRNKIEQWVIENKIKKQ